jgi:LysR family transcriptional regulator, low CO2-responsive transcriptional regulator
MLPPAVEYIIRHATFRQLQIFEAVVRLESFSRAAEALYLTQPTVSMQVAKLAETLGHPLFEQIGKRIFLTEAGRVMHGCCKEVFASMETAQMALADMAGLKQGRISISAVTTAEYFIPGMLGAFRARHPEVEIALQVLNRREVLERFAENADDLYIMGQPPEELDARATALLANPLVLVAARGHVLARKKAIPFARLAQEPMVVREAGSGTRKAMERLFAEAHLDMRIGMELGSNEAMKQAVAGGLGVAILSVHALRSEGKGRSLVVLDVEGFPLKKQWYLLYPKGKKLTPVAKAFHEYLLEAAAQL